MVHIIEGKSRKKFSVKYKTMIIFHAQSFFCFFFPFVGAESTENLIHKIIHETGALKKKLMRFIATILTPSLLFSINTRSFLFIQPKFNEKHRNHIAESYRKKSVNNLRIVFSNNMKFQFCRKSSVTHPDALFHHSICSPDGIKNSKNTFSTCLMGLCHFNIKNESNNAFIHVL